MNETNEMQKIEESKKRVMRLLTDAMKNTLSDTLSNSAFSLMAEAMIEMIQADPKTALRPHGSKLAYYRLIVEDVNQVLGQADR